MGGKAAFGGSVFSAFVRSTAGIRQGVRSAGDRTSIPSLRSEARAAASPTLRP